jgi:prepilin-type N-terminal cleavage/methylation domain-containing protein
MHPRAAAFTLLEIMVVIAIAALIIGIGAGAMQNVTEDNELRKASQAVEGIFMTAVHRAYTTSSAHVVAFDEQGVRLLGSTPQSSTAPASVTLPPGARLQLRRMGSDKLMPAAGQRVLLRPGGLCEPLLLQFAWQGSTLTASLDPLTGGFTDVEEFIQP